MIGAIIGDIVGSPYEVENIKTEKFAMFGKYSQFTDDTVLTIAVADAIISKRSYEDCIREYALKYRKAGYGSKFLFWLSAKQPEPYNSYGNGSAMRVSPVGYLFDGLEKVLEEAKKSADCTHNHPEGIKGAQSVAAAIFLARTGKRKRTIKQYIEKTFSYDLSRKMKDIQSDYKFDPSCQGTVPEAMIAFLESENFEDAIRKAVSMGGDCDTLTCITGSIAEAYYKKIPEKILSEALIRLPEDFLDVLNKCESRMK